MAEDQFELIHQEIDGVNSEVESARLREYFKKHPDAEQFHADLSQLNAVLAQVEDVPSPEGLRQDLLAALTAQRPPRTDEFRQPVRPGGLVLRYGYFLAAGLVLGVAVHAWWAGRESGPQLPGVSGTMAPSAATSHVLEQVQIAQESLHGSVQLRRRQSGYLLDLQLASPRQVDVVVAYGAGSLGLAGFAQTDGGLLALVAHEGRVEWTHEGVHGYTLRLHGQAGDGASITVGFHEQGRRIAEKVLHLPADS